MPDQQLELFFDAGIEVEQGPPPRLCRAVVPAEIEDEALIAAIPEADLPLSCALAAEAGRRRLTAAVPALTALCRRFAGFGIRHSIPEQDAAMEALATIGGRDAALAVAQMIEQAIVQGPGLRMAMRAAGLGASLSPDILRQLLRHAEPAIRADACRCARPFPDLILLLIDLLDDLDQAVATPAAYALGRMGRIEARSKLKNLLREDPSEDVLDAISLIADEECVVLLGRIARSGSILADAALASLDNIDLDRAVAAAAAVRRLPRRSSDRVEDGALQQSSCL